MRRVRLDDVQKDSSRVKDETEETSSREVVSAFFSFSFSFSSGDADREGTHRLRDEEREDAGDGGAAGHAAVDESARREETRGGVGCQSGCASSRIATFRGSAGKIKWDRARHVLGGRGGADGDVALGHGLSRDLGDDGGTGEEGGHGVGVGWRVWVCAGKNGWQRGTEIDDVSFSAFRRLRKATWPHERADASLLAPIFSSAFSRWITEVPLPNTSTTRPPDDSRPSLSSRARARHTPRASPKTKRAPR